MDAAVAALAGLAAREAFGREAKAVGVDRELHVVLQDLAAAGEARTAAARAKAERIGRQLVADDAEEIVVDVERFDRRVGAVAERRVDGVTAVGALRGAVAAAEDLEIDAVALLAEPAEAEGRRA